MEPFTEKEFNEYNLTMVNYEQCTKCGFVQSKTHAQMSIEQWEELNYSYHKSYFHNNTNLDDPNWISRLNSQLELLLDAYNANVISSERFWMDYGCGDGKLADYLSINGVSILKYDRYINKEDYLTDEELFSQKYDLIINTSVFEHILTMEDLNRIVKGVHEQGAFALHTFVCNRVPQSPDWFYYLPVHCSFFTNKSMEILFDKWGFKTSVYSPQSRMWIWFKKDNYNELNTFAKESKQQLFVKRGFTDYWR